MFAIPYLTIMPIPVQTVTDNWAISCQTSGTDLYDISGKWYKHIPKIKKCDGTTLSGIYTQRHLGIINVSWKQCSSDHKKHFIHDFGMTLIKSCLHFWHRNPKLFIYLSIHILESSYTLLDKPYSHALAGLVSVPITSLCWQKPIHLSFTPKSHVSQW